MTKAEAIAFLGISPRTLERYVTKGRLNVTHVRGKTGMIGDYDKAELEQLKAELEAAPKASSDPSGDEDASTSPGASTALAVPDSRSNPALAVIDASVSSGPVIDVASLGEKRLFTLDEVEYLTSVSKGKLRAAIAKGELKAGRVGRSTRIKPSALDEWIDKTF